LEAEVCPWFRGVGELDSSCHGGGLTVLELDWAEHPEGAVAALAEGLQVRKDRAGQLEAGPPAVPVQRTRPASGTGTTRVMALL